LGREDLDNALKAIMAAKREELGEPPTPEELLACRDGRLDPAARQSVADRLAVYPDAARTLADLSAFPEVEPAPGTPELSDGEVEARWQALRQKLGEVERPLTPSPSPIARPSTGRGELPSTRPQAFSPSPGRREGDGRGARGEGAAQSSMFRLAAAALLALGIGFLAGRGSRSDLPMGAVNVAIVELTPVEEGGTRSASEVELSDVSEELVLVLGPPDAREFPDYEAEVLDAEGARRWSRQGLQPTSLGTFHLAFRRDALPPGTYRIHLFGREGERQTPLATYELRLVETSGDR